MSTPPADMRPSFDRVIAVETPEHVALEFELAGLGSRAAAAIVDSLILVVLLMIVMFGILAVGSDLGSSWLLALAVVALFAVVWGYYVLFEAINDGRTPGKKALGIRVIMETGHRVTFGAAASRNLLRLVDGQPALTYVVASAFVFFDRQNRRLGDMVAGTIVVRDRVDEKAPGAEVSKTPAEQLAVPSEMPVLPEAEFLLLEQYLSRRDDLTGEASERIQGNLARRLAPLFPQLASETDFLDRVYREELVRRRSRVVSHQRNAPAAKAVTAGDRFAATRQAAWTTFSASTTAAAARGLRRLGGGEILAFAASYREVAADLARARTYHASPRVIHYLERLVNSAHNVLYGATGVRRLRWGELFFGNVPAAIIQARRFVLVATLTFFLPSLVAYTMIREKPVVAESVLPDEMLARAEAGRTSQVEGVGYAEEPSVFLPLVSSSIITNNIQVAFGAFAFGITAGLGTLVLLCFNGLFLGAILAHFANRGVAGWLLTFVVPHGVLEIPAIIIAGAAGLLIGYSVVAPGELSRRDALQVNGRLAIRLVGASAFLLVVAGLIEGFLSASDAPRVFRLIAAALGVLLLFLYLFAGYLNNATSHRSSGAQR